VTLDDVVKDIPEYEVRLGEFRTSSILNTKFEAVGSISPVILSWSGVVLESTLALKVHIMVFTVRNPVVVLHPISEVVKIG
jgi:hypothetical protein